MCGGGGRKVGGWGISYARRERFVSMWMGLRCRACAQGGTEVKVMTHFVALTNSKIPNLATEQAGPRSLLDPYRSNPRSRPLLALKTPSVCPPAWRPTVHPPAASSSPSPSSSPRFSYPCPRHMVRRRLAYMCAAGTRGASRTRTQSRRTWAGVLSPAISATGSWARRLAAVGTKMFGLAARAHPRARPGRGRRATTSSSTRLPTLRRAARHPTTPTSAAHL